MTVSKVTASVFKVALTALLTCGLLQSQEAREAPHHPGDILKFEIKFDGADAAKVKTIRIYLIPQDGPPPNQAGFNVTPQGGDFSPISPGVFQANLKIPDGAPTGTYLLRVNATAENGAGSATYNAKTDFDLHAYRIENPMTFTPPKIKVTEQH